MNPSPRSIETVVEEVRLTTWRFWILVLAIGVLSGLAGAAFELILHGVEHLAFGYSTGTFAEAVTQTSDLRRFVVLTLAGVIVSVIWFSLRRWGPKVPTVSEAAEGAKMPVLWTTADTALQVANVAAGASIGREGGPRQFGAMGSDRFSERFGLTKGQRLILIACGSGACLAAIYNSPLGGAAFGLEAVVGLALLWRIRAQGLLAVVAALATAYIATYVARLAVPNRPLYLVESLEASWQIYLFALVAGPLFGLAGYWFSRGFNWIGEHQPQGKRILWVMPLCYIGLAVISLGFPLVLGNGHAMSQELYWGTITVFGALGLAVAKAVAVAVTVGSGATGGKLTPSYSMGVALGIFVAGVVAMVWSDPSAGGGGLLSPMAAAAIGSGAFMAAAMNIKVAAVLLAIEYVAMGPALWPALVLCVAGGAVVRAMLARRFDSLSADEAAEDVVQ